MIATRIVVGYGSMVLLASAVALGEGARGEPSAEVKQAFQECFTKSGVKVEAGSRPDLTEEQRRRVGSCLRAKGIPSPRGGEGRRGPPPNREAMKACLGEAGVSLPEPAARGDRPVMDDATRSAFEQCRAKLGE